MRLRLTTGLIGLLVAVFAVFGLNSAQAQETGGTGFRVSPARYNLDTDPGTIITRPIEVTNLTDKEQRAIPVVNDFIASQQENGNPVLLVDSDGASNPRSIQPFVLPMNEFSLIPGQSRTVNVSLDIPADASPGAYYGVVRFVAETPSENDDANVTLTASVGAVFLVNVTGDTVQLLTLEEVGVAKSSGGDIGGLFSNPPEVAVIRIANQGNTFEAPYGTVTVKNWKGDTVYQYELNSLDPRGNVLPDSVRRFESPLENISSIGRYSLESFISYGDGGKIIEARSTFWVIPWAQLLVGVSLLALVVFFGTRGLKAYNARVVSKARKNY